MGGFQELVWGHVADSVRDLRVCGSIRAALGTRRTHWESGPPIEAHLLGGPSKDIANDRGTFVSGGLCGRSRENCDLGDAVVLVI